MTMRGRESTALLSSATTFKEFLKTLLFSLENLNNGNWAGNFRGVNELIEVLIGEMEEMLPELIKVSMAERLWMRVTKNSEI